MRGRVFIVEDDPAIRRLIDTNLSVMGYDTCCASDGAEALAMIEEQPFDLALLDVMLPEVDGFELLPSMRDKDIPVIFVSAKADAASRIQGLRLGAEDYIVKPFDMLEVLVRMEKVLARRAAVPETVVCGDVTLDEGGHTVHQAGQIVPLTPMEYELLRMFLHHPGMVLSRENLLRQVWGDEFIGETRTVDVHVAALRRKLGWNDRIATVYKLGYRLEVEL